MRDSPLSNGRVYIYLVVLVNSLIIALLPFVMIIAAYKEKKMKLLPDMPLIAEKQIDQQDERLMDAEFFYEGGKRPTLWTLIS